MTGWESRPLARPLQPVAAVDDLAADDVTTDER